MIERAASRPKIQTLLQSSGQIRLCRLHCFPKFQSKRQSGCNRTGKSAAGPMGIGILDPFAPNPVSLSIFIKQIIRRICQMPSFAENVYMPVFIKLSGCPFHILMGSYG